MTHKVIKSDGLTVSMVGLHDPDLPELPTVAFGYVGHMGLYGLLQQDEPGEQPHVILLTPAIIRQIVETVSDPGFVISAEGKVHVH